MSKEDLTKHLEHLKQLVEDDYIISLTTVFLGENDRVIGNNVGEPLPAHGILLLQDMANEMRDFMESPVKPYNRLRALGPEGGFIVVGEDGEEADDDDDDDDDDSEEE